jgi:hypothetical protein
MGALSDFIPTPHSKIRGTYITFSQLNSHLIKITESGIASSAIGS